MPPSTVKMPIASDSADAPAVRAIGGLPSTIPAVIRSGEALSDIINFRGPYRFGGIIMPDQWTAAAITFRASFNGTDFFDVYNNDNTEYTFAAPAASRAYRWPLSELAMFPYLQLRSGLAGATVNQGADRPLIIIGV